MKITIVGAGAVGASCAEYIAIKNFASEVVLLDIKEGFAEGKAMDLMQTATLNGFDTKKNHCFHVDQVVCFVDAEGFQAIPIPPEFRKKIEAYQICCCKSSGQAGAD